MTNLVKIERLFKQLSCPPIVGAGRLAHGRTIEKLEDLNFTLVDVTQSPNQKSC